MGKNIEIVDITIHIR